MDYTMEQKYQSIKKDLLQSKERDPLRLIKSIMMKEYINIHGPEHHFLDGASLLVAMKNNGLDFDLESVLDKLAERTIKMPGAMCGYWGICGSVASVGAVFSLLDGTGPLSNDESYKNHMAFTSKVIEAMSEIGGPRCCKRNAFISLSEGIKYANEHYNLNIPSSTILCDFSIRNKQCLGNNCPFYKRENHL